MIPVGKRWKSKTISASSEIRAIVSKGKKIQTRWYRVVSTPALKGEGRFAVLVGKRLGKAVNRNKIKRRFREIIRRDSIFQAACFNIIFIPYSPSSEEDFHTLQEAIHKTLRDLSGE